MMIQTMNYVYNAIKHGIVFIKSKFKSSEKAGDLIVVVPSLMQKILFYCDIH